MTEKKINISLLGWEKQNPLLDEEAEFIKTLDKKFSLKETKILKPRPSKTAIKPAKSGPTIIKLDYPSNYKHRMDLVDRKKSITERKMLMVEELRKDCGRMVRDLDEILELKESIVSKINQFYSDSSNLITKQKLLHIFSSEINNIFENILTKDRVLYYNNLLKNSTEATIDSAFTDNLLRYPNSLT